MFKHSMTYWVAFLLAGTNLTADAAADSDLYYGFTRIDPVNETLIPDSYLIVRDGLIETVGTGQPPMALAQQHYDMTGRYGLPGFVDAHAHITAGPHAIEMVDGQPLVTMESQANITEFNARMALAFGVTTVRNPGGDPQANADYDRRIVRGEWRGPDALHAGSVIQPPPFGGNAFAYPQSKAEWQAEAQRQAGLGSTYFKLYHGLSEEELATGIRVAHENGLQAIAHLDQISWLRAAELGIDGLLHALPTSADLLEPDVSAAYQEGRGLDSKFMYQWFENVDFDGPLMQNLLSELATQEVEVDLTLLVNVLSYRSNNLGSVFPQADRRYYHPETLAALLRFMQLSATGWTEEDFVRADIAMSAVFEFVRRLHAAGVPLMIGTDGNGGGPLYAQELQLHHQAGLSAWDVLYLATAGSAKGMGLGDHTGQIKTGYEADLVFLNANPLEDLANARNVELVVTNGQAFSFDELAEDNSQ